MLSVNVKITEDRSGWDKFAKTLASLSRKAAKIGIQADEDQELLQYAAQNEFGADIPVTEETREFFEGHGFPLSPKTTSITIPSRPFIRQTFEKRFEELKKIGFEFGGLIIDDKMTLDQALELWGDKFVSFIRSEIADGDNFEPNAPLTILLKGEGKHPLQDSGRLQQALKTVVEDK
jgi:hypothetical protein